MDGWGVGLEVRGVASNCCSLPLAWWAGNGAAHRNKDELWFSYFNFISEWNPWELPNKKATTTNLADNTKGR